MAPVYVGWEKRDWGAGKPTWRRAASVIGGRGGNKGIGPIQSAARRLSNRQAKAAWGK